MSILILGSLAGTLLGWLMGFLSIFLILLVLIQRGRGGGLTGALGGPGGQSAFGSKAGDTFTIITIVVASIWGFTCAFTMWLLGTHAPSVTDQTAMKAGPSESEEDAARGIVIPKPDESSFGETGLGGIGEASNTTTETPSMELTPKDTKLTETPADKPSGTDAEAAEPAKPDDPAKTPSDPTAGKDATAADPSPSQGNGDAGDPEQPAEKEPDAAGDDTSTKAGDN